MDQSDTIGKIELIPSFVLSSKSANSRNDIQLFPSCLMSIEAMEITINTYKCYERSKQWNDTSHISSLKVTLSHVIVILSVLPCQLSSKSNSHISLPLLQLYISQCIFQCNHFNFVQQCIQISTRINSSM